MSHVPDVDLRRVVVVGTSCAGKTTLARRLAATLHVPHVELDRLHWGPSWTPVPEGLFRERVGQAAAGDRWVFDGNYSRVRDLLWARATAVIWLDYPFPLVFRRAIARTIRRIVTRERLFSGNQESLRLSFASRDSILLWVITTHRKNHLRYREEHRAAPSRGYAVVRLRSPKEADLLLRSVATEGRT